MKAYKDLAQKTFIVGRKQRILSVILKGGLKLKEICSSDVNYIVIIKSITRCGRKRWSNSKA